MWTTATGVSHHRGRNSVDASGTAVMSIGANSPTGFDATRSSLGSSGGGSGRAGSTGYGGGDGFRDSSLSARVVSR